MSLISAISTILLLVLLSLFEGMKKEMIKMLQRRGSLKLFFKSDSYLSALSIVLSLFSKLPVFIYKLPHLKGLIFFMSLILFRTLFFDNLASEMELMSWVIFFFLSLSSAGSKKNFSYSILFLILFGFTFFMRDNSFFFSNFLLAFLFSIGTLYCSHLFKNDGACLFIMKAIGVSLVVVTLFKGNQNFIEFKLVTYVLVSVIFELIPETWRLREEERLLC